MSKHNWRWWFHVIHRDVGYLCVGLTLIYAISGIAVNHVADWNPNYAITEVHGNIGKVEEQPSDDTLAVHVLQKLGLPTDYRTLFYPSERTLRIVRENHTVDVDLDSGKVDQQIVTPRAIIHPANVLHLNHKKQLWTWVADAFAVCLATLAITGMFLIKGKKGITGRGLWLTAAGFAVPLFFLWLYA
jgi:hypothetical protein